MCGEGEFCNFEDPNHGFCEMCNNAQRCDEQPINGPEAELECNEVCNGKAKCNGSEYCGSDSFCSWGNPEYGFCEMCKNTNGCDAPSDYIVAPEGEDECKEICKGRCNITMLCGTDQFCNWENPEYGFCESCKNVGSCQDPPIQGPDGEQECKEICKGLCTNSEMCGERAFCNFEDPENGVCEMCRNVKTCIEPQIYGQKAEIECKVVCQGNVKCVDSRVCGKDSFCSWQYPELSSQYPGFCVMCKTTNGCEAPSDYIVIEEGQEECKEICKGKCNNTKTCDTDHGKFCNWEDPKYGFCEPCSQNITSCYESTIYLEKGEEECRKTCKCKSDTLYE